MHQIAQHPAHPARSDEVVQDEQVNDLTFAAVEARPARAAGADEFASELVMGGGANYVPGDPVADDAFRQRVAAELEKRGVPGRVVRMMERLSRRRPPLPDRTR